MDECEPKLKPKRSARVAAMDYLARREHARTELERKLSLKEYSTAEIAEALDRLALEGLQSDERFAENYLRHRFISGFGPRRIAEDLRQHGVASDLIDRYLADYVDLWDEHCQQVWRKKFNSPPQDIKEKAKHIRFLLQRGFTNEQIQLTLSVGASMTTKIL